MNEFVYVVSLAGKHVFHNWSTQCVIKNMSDLGKVRATIMKNYDIKFENLSSSFCNGWWLFENITDNRDIKLIVERVDVL